MVSERLRLSRRRRSRCDSECESVRRAAHGSRWPQSVLACGIPSDLQVASAENTTPLVTQYMHPPPRSTLGSAGVAGGSTAHGASSRRADKAAKLRRRARFVRSGGLQPARASGTRDDDDEAPTRQKELLLSVVIRPLVRRRHKPQKSRRVAAHEARRPQGPSQVIGRPLFAEPHDTPAGRVQFVRLPFLEGDGL
jgi:hypothetical protein